MTHHSILIRCSEPGLFFVETFSTEAVIDQTFEKLTIDDVRALKESAHRRPSEGSTQTCFVVRTSFITSEAQHALLKLLEEPPTTSRLVFVVPSALELLSTVLSRVHVEVASYDEKPTEAFIEFSKLALRERFEANESKIKSKDIVWQEQVRLGLITFLRISRQTDAALILDLEFVAANLLTRGSSNKMLLDQLALTLPLK